MMEEGAGVELTRPYRPARLTLPISKLYHS